MKMLIYQTDLQFMQELFTNQSKINSLYYNALTLAREYLVLQIRKNNTINITELSQIIYRSLHIIYTIIANKLATNIHLN